MFFRGFLSPYHPLLSMFGIPLFSVGEDTFIPILSAKRTRKNIDFFSNRIVSIVLFLFMVLPSRKCMVYYIAESAAKVIFHCTVLPYLALLDWTDTEG